MRFLPAFFVFLAACAADPVLADYADTLGAMRSLVTDHETAIGGTIAVADVPALESDYQQRWADLMNGMSADVDAMDCGMHADGMRGAMDGMGVMGEQMTDHMNDHADHTDLSQCQADEADHAQGMMDELDAMGDFDHGHGGWMMSGH